MYNDIIVHMISPIYLFFIPQGSKSFRQISAHGSNYNIYFQENLQFLRYFPLCTKKKTCPSIKCKIVCSNLCTNLLQYAYFIVKQCRSLLCATVIHLITAALRRIRCSPAHIPTPLTVPVFWELPPYRGSSLRIPMSQNRHLWLVPSSRSLTNHFLEGA